MPTWGEILAELNASAGTNNGIVDFDAVRGKYLKELNELTGRDVIVYSTAFLNYGGPDTSITLEDVPAMMEVCRGLKSGQLDLILHSPGGGPEATDSIVKYLRKQFSHIRVFVPVAAMSAATMWSLAADEIVMGAHSQLGPIDPQIVLPNGQFPARGIIEQFETAKEEIAKDPNVLGAWLPMLEQYGPSLLDQCEKAEELSKRLVREWLAKYMLAGDPKCDEKADAIAEHFGSYKEHQSHSLGIDRDQAREQGVNVTDLEADKALQDAVLSVHHATFHTFSGPAVKIVENHLPDQGRYFKMAQVVPQPVPVQPPAVP